MFNFFLLIFFYIFSFSIDSYSFYFKNNSKNAFFNYGIYSRDIFVYADFDCNDYRVNNVLYLAEIYIFDSLHFLSNVDATVYDFAYSVLNKDFALGNLPFSFSCKDDESLGYRDLRNRFVVYLSAVFIDKFTFRFSAKLLDRRYDTEITLINKKISYDNLFVNLKKISKRLSYIISRKDSLIDFNDQSFDRYFSSFDFDNDNFSYYLFGVYFFSKQRYLQSISFLKKFINRNQNYLPALILVALAYERLGKSFSFAISFYRKAYEIAFNLKIEKYIVFSSVYLARVFQKIGRFEEARSFYDNINISSGDRFLKAFFTYSFAIFSKSFSDYEKAYISFMDALRQFKNLGLEYMLFLVYCEIGDLAFVRGVYRDASYYYSRALGLSCFRVLIFNYIKLRMAISKCYLYLRDYDKARRYCFLAIEFATIYDLPISLSRTYLLYADLISLNFTDSKSYVNTFSKVSYYYDKAFSIADNFGNDFLKANIYDLKALLCFQNKFFDKALNFYRKAFRLYNLYYMQKYIARNLSYRANLAFVLNNFDKALNFYRKAFRLYQVLRDDINKAFIRKNIALIEFKKNLDFDKLVNSYDYVIGIFLSKDYKEVAAWAYFSLAEVYINFNKFDRALEYYRKSMFLFREIDSYYYFYIKSLIEKNFADLLFD